jgi:hypothetical protein
MPYVDKTFKRSARAGRRVLRGVVAIAIRSAVRPPLISVAAISLAALAAIAAFAQTPAPVTLSGLFDHNLADLKPTQQLKDAIKKAHRGDCYPPRATFKVVVAAGGDDSLFLSTLAAARGEALAATLPSLGLKRDQFKTGGAVESNLDNVTVTYDKFEPDDDKDPPKLKVTSIPKKGTKVKEGDKIKVTVKASERYEDGHKSWPTGVHLIQLTADDGLVDSKDYGRVPQPCERQTFEATYTVPRNPPPIVHLTAIAEDAVGNKDSEVGKFPTVEVWHGTDEHFYDITSNNGVEDVKSVYEELVRFDLYETSRDKLEGQAHATWTSSQEVTRGKCAGVKTKQDPETVAWDAQLSGSIQRLPGSTRFDFHATPDHGRPYKVIETPGGECTLGVPNSGMTMSGAAPTST